MDPTRPSGESTMDTGDWRTRGTLQPRQRVVDKIMNLLKMHLPFFAPEGLNELRKIALRIEERIFKEASSEIDYLQRISLKMLTMETKFQNTIPNNGNNGRQTS